MLEFGRNTAEHITCLGTTGPRVTLEFKHPQTEMPHPDNACIGVMTTEKLRHNEVHGPLAGLPERSHPTLWCTCMAVSESPGHFLISWFAVDPIRGQELRVERQSLWEGVPRWIYQWSAGLLISPSLPLAHKSVYKKRWSTAGAQEGLGKGCLMHEDQCIQDMWQPLWA